MRYVIHEMTENFANEISSWQYAASYDFYNGDASEEFKQELLEHAYEAIVNEQGELIGFFCTGTAAQVPKGHKDHAYLASCIDIGLGMKPALTGQGLGTAFFTFIIQHIKQNHSVPLRLTVAKFNERAIRLYEKLGFERQMEFSTAVDFIVMVQKSA
ncbi:GNAT family N-acetyltransferase [Lysinibacillus piscis]|uniref:N-acetyltransferase n=1 Tax=Lysinibacillus piscis TaxID=2518931 RepID=A0ABQ5NJN2_9BACI|nr:GNAT family N-acetyltransferase [Lysinibacillus sp. KH24]GLC88281.1 N-acetyltransferase [Lysinibacillus sp. KH24]